ncbi:MAG TPA: riboflavin synthase [Vicinamibacterales bacterium]|jgi:riboflavin synthase|nr:riboflavin synthase [Vicinamibacterales bacterium]
MFTGLVEAVGEVVERKQTSGGFRLRVASALASELKPGDSLAVNGVCLTVIVAETGEIHADIGPETVRVTTLGSMAPGTVVNLERPLRADSRLGGHFVQGHVDAIGYVEALRPDADFHWLTIGFPSQLAPFIVHKGSIAIDGISLTVAGLGGDRFDVQIVPFTMDHTNLRRAQARDRVNLECDMVGKYVVRAAELAGLTLTGARPGESTH